ncbi:MAG: DUF4446 family protein [Candidatus Roizmanbacteria bacterium]
MKKMTGTLVFSLLVLWLIVLTYVVVSTKRNYSALLRHTGGSVDQVFRQIVKKDEQFEKNISELNHDLELLKKKVPHVVQKVGIQRFDSYGREAGEQSIVLAILDDTSTGVIMTFLHTRDGVRVYGKHVEGGKGKEYDLSEEEKQAINKAS